MLVFTISNVYYRYKCLLFSVNSAAEVFQNIIAELLSSIPGTQNRSNNIVVSRKTQAEINQKSSVFANEFTFFGHVHGVKGISADPNKINTIINTAPSKNAGEVCSFLGMTQ